MQIWGLFTYSKCGNEDEKLLIKVRTQPFIFPSKVKDISFKLSRGD